MSRDKTISLVRPRFTKVGLDEFSDLRFFVHNKSLIILAKATWTLTAKWVFIMCILDRAGEFIRMHAARVMPLEGCPALHENRCLIVESS